MKPGKRRNWTLRGFIMAISIIFMVIAACTIFLSGMAISDQLRNHREKTYTSVLEMYSENLEEELQQIDAVLLSSVMIEGNVMDLMESTTDLDRYLAELRMKNDFSEETKDMNFLSGVAWYSPALDIRVKMFKKNGDQFEGNFQEVLAEVIDKAKDENPTDWFVFSFGEENYLVRLLENRGTYMVGWINFDTVLSAIEEMLPDDYDALYLKVNGALYGLEDGEEIALENYEEEKEARTQLLYPEDGYRVTFCLTLKENVLVHFMANPYFMVPFLIVITAIVLFIISLILSRYFIRPMDSLRSAMEKMQEGDFDVRIENNASFSEFTLLNDNFERMAARIKELKIAVYEQQLQKQTVELQYLQHQINPHFLTNCLNTIRNLLVIGKTEQAEHFTTLLSNNIRYNLTSKEMVTLEEELNHVNNYIAMQQIRHENLLKLTLSVDDAFLKCMIPNMVMQTFVENAVKHQLLPEEVLEIAITVCGGEDWIRMEIEDSGDGFEPAVLKALCERETVIKNGVECIGIENVLKRLAIIYGGRDTVTFSNGKKGALVMITLPMEEKNETQE